MLDKLIGRLTIRETADYLGVNHTTIYRAIDSGKITCFESNKTKYITIHELEKIEREKIFCKKDKK